LELSLDGNPLTQNDSLPHKKNSDGVEELNADQPDQIPVVLSEYRCRIINGITTLKIVDLKVITDQERMEAANMVKSFLPLDFSVDNDDECSLQQSTTPTNSNKHYNSSIINHIINKSTTENPQSLSRSQDELRMDTADSNMVNISAPIDDSMRNFRGEKNSFITKGWEKFHQQIKSPKVDTVKGKSTVVIMISCSTR
jgi:hypothetical protein